MKTLIKQIEFLFTSDDEKIRKEIIESINLVYKNRLSKNDLLGIDKTIDWLKIINVFNAEYEKLYDQINRNKNLSGLLNNKDLFKRKLKEGLKERILINILLGKPKFDIEKEMKMYFSQYYFLKFIEGLEQESYKKLFEKNLKYLEKGLKHSGKQISKDRLEAYEKIFIKNDEYRLKWNKNNFRSIAFNEGKKLGYQNISELENFYKSFSKFKKQNSLTGHNSFKKYLSTYRKLI